MVIYDLICGQEHKFEGWFKSEQDYKDQLAHHLLTCPVCNSSEVRKLPTASYVSKGNPKPRLAQNKSSAVVQEAARIVSKFIAENTEDVGTNFAEEAKKIHYGEAENRGIRGVATTAEVKELNEEGVSIFSIPDIAMDKNKLN